MKAVQKSHSDSRRRPSGKSRVIANNTLPMSQRAATPNPSLRRTSTGLALGPRGTLAYPAPRGPSAHVEAIAPPWCGLIGFGLLFTPFNFYRVDSAVEDIFARDCEESEAVKFFFKIPRGFKIPTPIGNYTPDWAVVLEQDNKLYFVAETKSTRDPDKLRGAEKLKIRLGTQFFEALDSGVKYKMVLKAEDLIEPIQTNQAQES